MSTIVLEAEIRSDKGKGASRRLRRLENKVPGIVYGGMKDVLSIHLAHNKVIKALETESIYSSVLDLNIDGKKERVILKDLQRHPVKPVIMHMDFQRVSAKDVLIKMIPLHFLNQDDAPGLVEGGVINHTMVHVEVKCQVKDLPEYIEVDLKNLNLDEVIHMTDIQLPKGVSFAVDPSEGGHDHPVVSIHMPRAEPVEEELEVVEDEEALASTEEGAKASAEGETSDEEEDNA